MLNQDNNYNRHPFWNSTIQDNENYQKIWNRERLLQTQRKITELLEGVSEEGRPIIVPMASIENVLSQVMDSYRPAVGSIYSRYIQAEPESTRNDMREIYDRAINMIVSQVRNDFFTEQKNRKLTKWNTLYGDANPQGLRQHPEIKLRKKRPMTMAFHMSY